MTDPNQPLQETSAWKLNLPDVSADVIGCEVVAIHLPTGMYYSLENAATTVWTAIDQGHNFAQIVQILEASYKVERAQAATDVELFLKDLLQEKLIVETSVASPGQLSPVATRRAYAGLVLEKFPDLQHLLMIDPIHEVDQRGWPHTKPE